jgi:hypothetical protein
MGHLQDASLVTVSEVKKSTQGKEKYINGYATFELALLLKVHLCQAIKYKPYVMPTNCTVKKDSGFPVPSRDDTDQTLSGREKI